MNIKKIGMYTILIIGAFIMLFPFLWMILSALKGSDEIMRIPPTWFPETLRFDNFAKALQTAPFAKYFVNSLIVTICVVAGTTFTTILAAFAFSRLKFPGRDIVFTFFVSLMMVPWEMLVITNYTTMAELNLLNTLPALILPFMASIFYTYILRNFFLSIPDSLYYSARIDGASNWKYLWKIMVPMAKPAIFTITLLNVIAAWNSFLWPLLVINSSTNRTLPLGLYVFITEGGTHYELLTAAATIIIIPILILFLFTKKYIIEGTTRGGIKG